MDIESRHRGTDVEAPPPMVSGGVHTLRVAAALPPGWAGRVAAALAARRINVVRGRARREGAVAWRAELQVELPPGTRADGIDLAALAAAPDAAAGPSTRVALSGFRLEALPGELVVEVRAPDEVGLLGRLLGVFAMFALFPYELELDTRGREAVDRFRLRAVGDRPPPPELASALRGMLERLAAG